jgi:hypothetical protein
VQMGMCKRCTTFEKHKQTKKRPSWFFSTQGKNYINPKQTQVRTVYGQKQKHAATKKKKKKDD